MLLLFPCYRFVSYSPLRFTFSFNFCLFPLLLVCFPCPVHILYFLYMYIRVSAIHMNRRYFALSLSDGSGVNSFNYAKSYTLQFSASRSFCPSSLCFQALRVFFSLFLSFSINQNRKTIHFRSIAFATNSNFKNHTIVYIVWFIHLFLCFLLVWRSAVEPSNWGKFNCNFSFSACVCACILIRLLGCLIIKHRYHINYSWFIQQKILGIEWEVTR